MHRKPALKAKIHTAAAREQRRNFSGAQIISRNSLS